MKNAGVPRALVRWSLRTLANVVPIPIAEQLVDLGVNYYYRNVAKDQEGDPVAKRINEISMAASVVPVIGSIVTEIGDTILLARNLGYRFAPERTTGLDHKALAPLLRVKNPGVIDSIKLKRQSAGGSHSAASTQVIDVQAEAVTDPARSQVTLHSQSAPPLALPAAEPETITPSKPISKATLGGIAAGVGLAAGAAWYAMQPPKPAMDPDFLKNPKAAAASTDPNQPTFVAITNNGGESFKALGLKDSLLNPVDASIGRVIRVVSGDDSTLPGYKGEFNQQKWQVRPVSETNPNGVVVEPAAAGEGKMVVRSKRSDLTGGVVDQVTGSKNEARVLDKKDIAVVQCPGQGQTPEGTAKEVQHNLHAVGYPNFDSGSKDSLGNALPTRAELAQKAMEACSNEAQRRAEIRAAAKQKQDMLDRAREAAQKARESLEEGAGRAIEAVRERWRQITR